MTYGSYKIRKIENTEMFEVAGLGAVERIAKNRFRAFLGDAFVSIDGRFSTLTGAIDAMEAAQ